MRKIGNLNLYTNKDKVDLAKKVGEDISAFLDKNRKKDILFLLSGGSAFLILDYIKKSSLRENITISVLDERYDITNKNNNFSQLKKTDFFKNAKDAGVKFIDTSIKDDTSENDIEEIFSFGLKKWTKDNPNGIIVATIGVGADGHTSGIMPYPEDKDKFRDLFMSEKWVVFYDASKKNQYAKRITTTITFFKKIDFAFVYIFGKEKKQAFLNMQKEGDIADVPARAILNIDGNLYIDEFLID